MILTVLLLMNLMRTQPLVEDKLLDQRAQARAEYLCEHHQWSHEGWLQSFEGLPLTYQALKGENLARNFKTPKQEFKALMQSPPHEANIVKKGYSRIGIGHACDINVYLFAS